MTIALDPYLVGRYWNDKLTELALSHQPSPTWIDDDWDSKFENALGKDDFDLFWFEVRAADCYRWIKHKDVSCRQSGSVHQQFARQIYIKQRRFPFPNRLPTPDQIPDVSCNVSTFDVAPASPRRKSEKQPENARSNCAHKHLVKPSPEDLFNNSRIVLANSVSWFDQYLESSLLPTCKDCGSVICCKCVEEDLIFYLGQNKPELDRSRLPSHCSGSLGFAEGICDLCNSTASLIHFAGRKKAVVEGSFCSELMTLDGISFRNIFSAMLAIRHMRQVNPEHFKVIFQNPPKNVDGFHRQLQADAFGKILLGESTVEAQKHLEVAMSECYGAKELWRHYWTFGRNIFRKRFGLPEIGTGWVREVALLESVRKAFLGQLVQHQARPDWLKGLTLDIFVPDVRIAFEHQGDQHFKPVEHFGGEDAFEKLVKRDRRKARLCAENNVRLIYFTTDDEISVASVRSKLNQ